MEFSPNNKIVKRCLQGQGLEENGRSGDASELFLQAWNEASQDFEKFIAAHCVSRTQRDIAEKLQWLETALQYAVKINDDSVASAFPFLYSSIAKCHEGLGDSVRAAESHALASSFKKPPSDQGPFYHGTKANLQAGDLLTPGGVSNYQADLIMNHIYFTALISGAGLAAALAKGDGEERVYVVEPTGSFENDPNVTNQRFPGNLTRSYRSEAPLRIVGEVTDWLRQTPEEREKWRAKLAANKGQIIN